LENSERRIEVVVQLKIRPNNNFWLEEEKTVFPEPAISSSFRLELN